MVKQKNVKYNKYIKAAVFFFLALSFIFTYSVSVFAEGSRNMLIPKDTLPSWATPFRPFTEWMSSSYAGMLRQQIIKVYAKAGETLFFGSSTHNSTAAGNNRDIKVTLPSGSSSYYNVINEGNGHIHSIVKEAAGPLYTDGGVIKNSGGYTPFRINVTETGIYLFEFYNPGGNISTNPSSRAVTAAWSTNNTGTVAAWDVTVVKNLGTSGGTGISETVKGRVFCNYLCMNMGQYFCTNTSDWGKGLYSTVYILTTDGYIYKTDFNGMDPYAFLFFANSRGLINPENNASLYRSARASNNNLADLKVTLVGKDGSKTISPVFHLPSDPDTAIDRTHMIFFDEPAEDLPESIRATPFMPGTVTDFRFVGEDDNIGYVSAGGMFKFNVTSGSSFQIKIDFTENYANTGRAANTLYLSNACQPGENSIYWDGRDGNGDVVPKGVYGTGESDGSIKIIVEVKAGEYHFPLMDVESNPFGVKIELVNTPFNADGSLYDWGGDKAAEAKARTTVYYDNSLIIQKGSETNSTAVGGTTRGAIWKEINKQLYALDGVDSKNGASRFMATSASGSNMDSDKYGGDFAFIDLWTYTVGDSSSVESSIEEFELIEPNAATTSQLRGLVYYDYDTTSYSSSANYNIQKGDFPLEGVTVEIYDGDTLKSTTKTDINGNYYITGLEIGKNYSVRVYSPYKNGVFTTHHSSGVTTTSEKKYLTFLTGALAPALNNTKDVGIHYSTYDKTLQVTKQWAKTVAEDPTRPSEIVVSAVGRYNGVEYVSVDATLNAFNGWSHTFYNLPARNDNNQNLVYTIVESGCDGYDSLLSDPQITDGGKVTLYTMLNIPRELKIYKHIDKPSTQDQYFVFRVEGNTDGIAGVDTTFDILIKVPAGQMQGTQTVMHIPQGVYTITELGTNWRYELDTTNSKATVDGTDTAFVVGKALTLNISGTAIYNYIFKNNLSNPLWLDYSAYISNKMKPLS